jgi:hypothetical protein
MALIDDAVAGEDEFVGASPEASLLEHALEAAAASGRAVR